MNKLFLVIFMFFGAIIFAQNKSIDKIKTLYDEGEFEKCIIKSESYLKKNSDFAAPYFYIAMSKYILYDKQSDLNSVKQIAKNLYSGMKKDNEGIYKKLFEKELFQFKEVLKTYAFNYYEANKTQAKFYYEYLAKIYNDTLAQYNEIVLNESKRPDSEIIEQINKGKLNQSDNKGLKQGPWKKVYSNGVTAYEVSFVNDKPVGEYKRYHENGKLSSKLFYTEKNDTVIAIFFNENEEKIAEGKYIGQKKVGVWSYYKNTIKVKDEENTDGKLNGYQTSYYENGQIYDRKKFINDIQEGVWEKYHQNGNPSIKAFLINGKLEGTIIRYYKSGMPEVKGQYKNDLKEGIWTFFGEQGQKDTIEFKNGIDVNEEINVQTESEEYKTNIEKSKNLTDPSKLNISNPEQLKDLDSDNSNKAE
jgi:antitoxin component YwqK of YwqJK toxin-antitoxin module